MPAEILAIRGHNLSDPGITLVELLAYVTEALAWQISRVTPQAQLQLLRLHSERWPGRDALRGAPASQVNRAIDAAVSELGAAECAVTAEDFEQLAVAAAGSVLGPGRAVRARSAARASTRTRSARSGSPRAYAGTHVTVVVVPHDTRR